MFIKSIIERYKDNPAILRWQIENEPFLPAGPNEWWMGKTFLLKEIELVKNVDNLNRPVIVNIMTFSNIFLRFLAFITSPVNRLEDAVSLADIIGLDIYPTIGKKT